MPDIFISYSRDDMEIARRFAEGFAKEGLDVWWDQTLRSGEAYDEITERALKTARAVVVLWSKTSAASRWVRAEATIADRNKTLVPAMIERCERPIMFELTQTAELSAWRGDEGDKAWIAFREDVKRRVAARAPAAARKAARREDAETGKPSILVLPFANMSGEEEQEFFSDGVTEDIITDLGRISALSVSSRNASFALKGKTVAAADLARDHRATHILEGSVRKSGERIRVTAQLSCAKTDQQVWAERFDRKLDDIFAIQAEISTAIAGALKIRLAEEEKSAIARRGTESPEAYEYFLMARRFYRIGSERMQPLIERICMRIVEIDPNFAAAHALMAVAQADMNQRGVPRLSGDAGRRAATRAIELDPALAEAHASLADVILREELDLDAARPHAEQALRLDSDCYEANLVMGYAHLGARRFPQAIAAFERAAELEPNAVRPLGMVVQAYHGAGDDAGARDASRRLIARCEKLFAVEPDHGNALGFFVSALADLGEKDRAREWTKRAILFDSENLRMRYNLACAMADVGDVATASELIEGLAGKVNLGWINWIEKDNSLDTIRGDERFKAALAKLKASFAASGRPG